MEDLLAKILAAQNRTNTLLNKLSGKPSPALRSKDEYLKMARDPDGSPGGRIAAALSAYPLGLSQSALADKTELDRGTIVKYAELLANKDLKIVGIEDVGGSVGKKIKLLMKYDLAIEKLQTTTIEGKA